MNNKHLFQFLFLISIFYHSDLFSQNEQVNLDSNSIIKTKYTVLDRDSKKFRPFFSSKSGLISFDLVELKNLNTDSKVLGVEVNIQTSEFEPSSSSIAFGSFGSLWGGSSSITYTNIRNKGYIFLTKDDLDTILQFLNQIIGATGQVQDKYTIYKISLRDQFEIGMVYEPDIIDINKWGFIFSSNNSTYRLNYQDGIGMLKSLVKFHKYINENQID